MAEFLIVSKVSNRNDFDWLEYGWIHFKIFLSER